MKQPLCDWMAAANGFAIYSAHMIPWPRSGMVSLPIKRRLPRKRRAVGHNPRIITALRLLYHSNKPIRACLPQSGSETGKAGFGCGVTCAVRCFAAAAAIRGLQTALPFALRILYHITHCVSTNFSPTHNPPYPHHFSCIAKSRPRRGGSYRSCAQKRNSEVDRCKKKRAISTHKQPKAARKQRRQNNKADHPAQQIRSLQTARAAQ